MTAYLEQVVQPGEVVEYETHLHPIIYMPGVFLIVFGIAFVGKEGSEPLLFIVWVGGGILLLHAWLHQVTTEIGITNLRVIYKTGLIRRDTIEMNRAKIESIDVSQSILGRLLDYGTVTVRGTGLGIEPIRQIKAPLTFRGFLRAR